MSLTPLSARISFRNPLGGSFRGRGSKHSEVSCQVRVTAIVVEPVRAKNGQAVIASATGDF